MIDFRPQEISDFGREATAIEKITNQRPFAAAKINSLEDLYELLQADQVAGFVAGAIGSTPDANGEAQNITSGQLSLDTTNSEAPVLNWTPDGKVESVGVAILKVLDSSVKVEEGLKGPSNAPWVNNLILAVLADVADYQKNWNGLYPYLMAFKNLEKGEA